MHVLISVVLDNWSANIEANRALKEQMAQRPEGSLVPRHEAFRRARGCLLVVDWDGRSVMAARPMPMPLGFAFHEGDLYVACWREDDIQVLRGDTVVRRTTHRWFNHPHTLDRTRRGWLVTSSGTDLIAEIDDEGQLLWEYFMFEHGYGGEKFPLGKVFDRSKSYNAQYLPSALCTHPNSAILEGDDTVLATLFASGELVRIDRRTGQCDVVLDGLKRPHSIRRREGGYMLSDTEGGEAVLLDERLSRVGSIPIPAGWIQDTMFIGDRVFAVGNRRIIIDPSPADTDAGSTNAVMEVKDGKARVQLDCGPEHRLYLVEPITEAQARGFAEAWRGEGFDTSFITWRGEGCS
jgi:hypothetical protein